MRGAFASVVALAAWLAASCALADPAHDFADAQAALKPHVDDSGLLDDEVATRTIIGRMWRAAEAVAAGSPGDAAQVKAKLAALDKDMDVRVAVLDPQSVLVGLFIGGAGDVFIVKKGDVAWRIADPRNVPGAEFRPLLAWSDPSIDCRSLAGDGWAVCAGISPLDIGRLPDEASGVRRFWIDGTYAQQEGETNAGQLSFWSWDGAQAAPLLLRLFQFHIDIGSPPTLAGDVFRLQVKDDFRTTSSCGACAGRQRLWRFELSGAGVRDLGKQSLVPELDVIDELYDRILHGRSLTPLATPAAARAILKNAGTLDRLDPHPSLGMSTGWTLRADHRRLCFSADDLGAMLFNLARKRAGFIVTAARPLGDGSCANLVHWRGATSGS